MTELSDSDFLPTETSSPPRAGLGLVGVALLLPVVAGVLLCFATSLGVALAISTAMVLVTAALVVLDASRLGRVDLQGHERESPYLLLAGMLVLWIVVFPLAFFRRSAFTKPNLGLVALLVAVFPVGAPIVASLLIPPQLPSCTSPEVVRVLEGVLRSSSDMAAARKIDGYREVRFDSAAQVRHGECVAHFDTGDVPVPFLVEWQNRQQNLFQVRLVAAELPSCDSLTVKQLLEQVIRQTPVGATARSIDGHHELKYDTVAGVRQGECIAHLESEDVAVRYFVEWQDRNKTHFQVRLAELELPACDSPQIVKLLDKVIRNSQLGASIRSIDGHRELRYDPEADVRHGECIAHLESGDVPMKFFVEWQDRNQGLIQVLLSRQELPACTSSDVVQVLEEVIRNANLGGQVQSIDGHHEVKYDTEAEVRHGECIAHLESGDVTVPFLVEWQDRRTRRFQVRLPAQELPSCTSPPVVQLLEQMIRKTPVGATAKAIAGHRELNYDEQAKVRVGVCTVELDDRDLTVTYRVEWQNQDKGLFQIRVLESK